MKKREAEGEKKTGGETEEKMEDKAAGKTVVEIGEKKKVDTGKGTDICNDAQCPFHGKISLRGRVLWGTVVGSKAAKTATVVRDRRHYLPKYQRYEKRWTKMLVHNPPCIDAEAGDYVKMMESRPISKRKHFIIINKIKPEERTGGKV